MPERLGPRRPVREFQLTDSGPRLSAVGLCADTGPRADLARWKTIAEKARNAGVTLFDLSALAPDKETYLRAFLGHGSPASTVIVGRSVGRLLGQGIRLGDGPGRAGMEGWAELLRSSVIGLAPAAGAGPALLVEWELTPDNPALDQGAQDGLQELAREGAIAGWGARGGYGSEGPGTETPMPQFVSRPLSLLEPLPPGVGSRGGPALFARDPFAGGRLDGSRFESEVNPLAVGHPPTPVSSIREEFDPVLRLAPLTRPGERTLAQAALRYVLDVAGAAAALVSASDPKRLAEFLDFESTPVLSPEDIDFLGRLPRTTPPFLGPRGLSRPTL